MPTTTASATWPTVEELAEVETAFTNAIKELDGLQLHTYWAAIVNDMDVVATPPTLAELGVLTRLITLIELDLSTARSHLDDIVSARDRAAVEMFVSV
jgi:hypothetical protein